MSRFRYFVKKMGLLNTLKFAILKKRKSGLVSFNLKGYKQSIVLRAQTSDAQTFEQIFIRGDYDIAFPIEPKFIIDGGAYIGLSSVYFLNRFPNAKIIAVEPASINFEMLKQNTSGYKNVILYNCALWPFNKQLTILDEGLGEWGFLVKESIELTEKRLIEAITIVDILKNTGFENIDILKLDIEGSEVELFSQKYENWLGKVKVLIVELHDNIRPGCRKSFEEAICKFNFTHFIKGENEVLISKDIL